MSVRLVTHDTGFGVGLFASTVIHLAVFLLLFWWNSQHPSLPIQETYYVDVVNLPVANPRSGSSSQQASEQTTSPPAPVEDSSQVLPSTTAAKKTPPKAAEPRSNETPEDFSERMAKLERNVEARQQEAALSRLKEKIKAQGSGRSGMPGKQGTESGSDYTAYLKSRLEDALEKTASYSSKNPEVVVRIFIDTDGKLSKRKTERSSGDRAFEISVLRAIELASEKFPRPPNRSMFEGVFVFKPKGITTGKP